MKLFYTPEAIDDLRRSGKFIAKKNPSAAEQIGSELVDGISKLKDFPHMGQKVPLAPNPEMVRDFSVGVYVVRYLVINKELHILRVWHRRESW